VDEGKNADSCKDFVKKAEELKNDRATWDSHMADIAEVIRPLRTELRGNTNSEGTKRMSKVFDGSGIKGLQNLGAGLYGLASNPADQWGGLGTLDEDRNRFGPNRAWLDRTSKQVLGSFGPNFGDFYAQCLAFYLDGAGFGTAIFTTEVRADHSGFIDRCRALSTSYIDTDGEGTVDTLYRRWMMTPAQAATMFTAQALSEKTQADLKAGKCDKREFLQYIGPNSSYVQDRIGPSGKPVASVSMEIDTCHEIKVGGFLDLPFQCFRWGVAEGERYGRECPGELSLPDVKSSNVMTKANLEAGERAARPSLGAYSEQTTPIIRDHPGKVTYGALDRAGNQLVKPLYEMGSPPFSVEMAEALRSAIKEYFYFSLLPVMNRTGLAPIETLERQEATLRMMAPYLGRINGDFLIPAFMLRYRRLLRVTDASGQPIISPPPPDLAGHTLQVNVVSPMAQAQKSARAAGVLRFEQSIAPILARDPTASARINSDKEMQIVAEGYNVDGILNDDDTTDAARQQQQRMIAAQQGATIAKDATAAAQSGATAIQTMRGPQPKQAA
jgi:hypothetical protein